MNRSPFFNLCNGSIFLFILLLATHVIAQTTDDTTMPSSKFHDEGSHRSFGPGTTALLVFFITAFLLTGFISIYLRRCRNRRFSLPRRANGTSIFRGSLSLSPGHGLDPAVVSTFPTFLYSQVKGHRIGPTALECAVCLLEFEDDHILRLLPICSHVFHPVCIDEWLALHDTCPVCRANLVPEPGELTTHVSTTLCRCDPDSNLAELNSPPAGCGIGSGSVDLIIDIIDASTTEHDQTPNQIQNRPPRSTPRKPKNTGNKFHRSHSTGHSIVQPGENCERFTLRLPEDVRSQLMKRSPRSSSARVFMSVRSPREGYRSSSSIGTSRDKNYKRFHSAGRSGGWSFRMTSPFPSQTASVRSPGDDLTATPRNYKRFHSAGRSGGWSFRMTSPFPSQTASVRSLGDDLTATPRNLKGSVKSPLDRLFRSGSDKDDDSGRRSTSRLIPDGDG